MIYIRVEWKHSFPNEPVWLYSELDDLRWEVRKVEVYRDGHEGFASAHVEVGGTGLGLEPVPPFAEIVLDPQFEASEISKDEFERVWGKRFS